MQNKTTQRVNAVLIALFLCSILAMGHSAYSFFTLSVTYFKYHKALFFIFFGLGPFLSVISIYQRPTKTKIDFLIVTCTTYLCVCLGDFTLLYFKPDPTKTFLKELATRAEHQHIAFDTRSTIQVLLDLNKQQTTRNAQKIFTRMTPRSFWQNPLLFNEQPYQPIHDIPDSDVVLCNEKGYWLKLHNDRFGFNNNDQNWNTNSFTATLIGDSFGYGYCVERKDNLTSQLSHAFPKTISLGAAGNGPLTELATVREFLHYGKNSKVFFWLFYEGNDFQDMDLELASPLLTRYLNEAHFAQETFKKSEQIKPLQQQAAENTLARALASGKQKDHFHIPLKKRLKNAILFSNIRQLLLELIGLPQYEPQYSIFKTILSKAKHEIESHQSKIVFVFLPTHDRYTLKNINSYRYFRYGAHRNLAKEKKKLFTIVRTLGLDIIDIDQAFQDSEAPRSLYYFDLPTHYNESGYRLVSQKLTEYLNSVK